MFDCLKAMEPARSASPSTTSGQAWAFGLGCDSLMTARRPDFAVHEIQHAPSHDTLSARLVVIGVVTALIHPALAFAQAQPAEQATAVSLTVSGIFSIQPDDNLLQAGPYLDGSLGGSAPGAAVALAVHDVHGWLVDVEVSSTLAISEMQRGRLVSAFGALKGSHRDTLVSILPGYRVNADIGSVEFKGGVSGVMAQSSRDGKPLRHDIAGRFGLTGGIDWTFGAKSVQWIVGLKYSYVRRGHENYYLGLGNHLVRAAAGARIRLR